MLKERDKKILFYSWSYGILASALIYVCCGYGALAACDALWTDAYTHSTNNGGVRLDGIFVEDASVVDSEVDFVYYEGKVYSTVTDGWNNGTISFGGMWGRGSYQMNWHTDTTSSYTSDGWIMVKLVSTSFTSTGDSAWYSFDNCASSSPNQCPLYYKDGSVDAWAEINNEHGALLTFGGALPYGSGTQITFGGDCPFDEYNPLPPAPVINDFTSDASCYNPGEAIVLESNVTGTVDTWYWEIYDSLDVQKWSSNDSIETIVDTTLSPGLYQVQLYVENTGGNDFLSKEDWLNVTIAGGCLALNNWSPFPTQTTIVPTQAVFPTMTMPPYLLVNLTGINELIDEDPYGLGNLSRGYRSTSDLIFGGVNETLVMTFSILLTPVTLVTSGLAAVFSLFSSSMSALMSYTTVPLAITAKVINAMPWQIVTLITAGIAVDAILIVLGKL